MDMWVSLCFLLLLCIFEYFYKNAFFNAITELTIKRKHGNELFCKTKETFGI